MHEVGNEIGQYVAHACQAIVIRESTKAEWQSEDYRSEAVGAIKRVRQKRPMTDDLLRQIAETHQATEPDYVSPRITDANGRLRSGRIVAIMDKFHVADSTARLYLAEARKRLDPQTAETFLPPSTRRKAI